METDLYTAVFISKGAALESFVLKGRKQQKHTSGGEDAGVELAHPGEGQPAPLSVEIGGAPLGLGTDLGYRLASRTETSLVYERTKNGRKVTKTFRWSPGSYKLGLEVAVAHEGGEPEALPVEFAHAVAVQFRPAEQRVGARHLRLRSGWVIGVGADQVRHGGEGLRHQIVKARHVYLPLNAGSRRA